ncbi:MAG: ABC transporter substrate-binding protein [Candidatus Izimaplasma sp.]|nr:ABC transporter substrate-binding protein [Candidatus Izimaplasma bacterium]
MKKVYILIVLLALIVSLSACGGDDGNSNETPDGEVAITFWNIFTGPDGEEMKAMVEDFNTEHAGDIRVVTQTVPANDFYEVLNTSVPQGQGPDVAIMHLDHIQRYASLGMLDDFETLLENSDFDGSNYIPQVWDAGMYEGKRYTIPLDVHPIGLYYNKDILDDAGVSVPTTYDEMVQACADLEGYVDHCFPVSAMWPSQTLFTASLFQHGADDLDGNGEYPAYNSQAGYEALKVFHDLVYVDHLSAPNIGVDEDLALFRQGNAAFHINGIWMLNGIKESGINFGTASIATLFGDEPAVWAGSHNFIMPRASSINPEKQEAILTFIEYITNNSLRWATAGQIPANLTVLASEEYQALEYHQTFVDIDDIKFVNASPYFEDAFSVIYSRVTEAMTTENADIQALLDAAEQEGIQRVDEALGR